MVAVHFKQLANWEKRFPRDENDFLFTRERFTHQTCRIRLANGRSSLCWGENDGCSIIAADRIGDPQGRSVDATLDPDSQSHRARGRRRVGVRRRGSNRTMPAGRRVRAAAHDGRPTTWGPCGGGDRGQRNSRFALGRGKAFTQPGQRLVQAREDASGAFAADHVQDLLGFEDCPELVHGACACCGYNAACSRIVLLLLRIFGTSVCHRRHLRTIPRVIRAADATWAARYRA